MKKKKYIFKIKDLPLNFNLVGCKIGRQIIVSGWNKGFWTKMNEDSQQLHPVFFQNFDQIKEWKVEVPPERALTLILHESKIKPSSLKS